jgi:hypothetical protein
VTRASIATTLLVLVAVTAACSPERSASPAASMSPSSSPSASAVPSVPASNAAGVVVDAALLAVLPATVDGVAIVESTDGETDALSDPTLPQVAVAIAAGLAIDPASGEFVYAVVVRLREGAISDERFRDWRDSFDEGACSQAGGVVGHAEAEIAGRTVYIGSCVGGVLTYHVWLREPRLLVSASAVGERRLGERLVEGLRP